MVPVRSGKQAAAAHSSVSVKVTPGFRLPTDAAMTRENTLYHARRSSGAMGTMIRLHGTWYWRLLSGTGPGTHGHGDWKAMQQWLSEEP